MKGYIIKRGQTIKLYIYGDDLKNIKTAELSNWTGKAYIGERKHSKLIQGIEELKSPGVYLLLSRDMNEFQIALYVGEADEVNKRISNHLSGKNWWTDFVIFISKDTNLTKSHVRYLEKKLYNISSEKPTLVDLKNNSNPTGSKLPISEMDDMDEFLEKIIFILKNLGIINLEKVEVQEVGLDEDNIFYLDLTKNRIDEENNKLQAKLQITNDGYRLLKGSFIENEERPSFKKHIYYPLRKQFETNKYMQDSEYDGCSILIQDIDVRSPSAAASIVKNRATNGPKEWKLKDGTTLDEFQINNQSY